MNRPVDPVSDDDLQAYVDDQLSVARRIDVEAYLSANPAAASRVMGDLRIRDELRLALAETPRSASTAAARLATVEAARRLQGALARARWSRRFRVAATVALLLGAGWIANAQFGHLGVSRVVASGLPPAYLEDAVRAHRTALVRADMPSQPGSNRYDPAEILSATAIVMPVLPEGWKVEDVQVFPSTFGPSVEMTVEAGEIGTASLFAVRPGGFDVVPATSVPQDELTAAYWQVGEVAYALVAHTGDAADSRDLDRAAARLARTLY
ncbi:anti-sigma factor [Ancylobacter dichloromethanicus]|uniref:Transcriptional regulator, anti-sigma factor n=1 Tax=Ancylobacter dichloromethanicus TaxID=518825 RepID=A0A9W6JAA4_9HYPH|nr:anti-sigma factor [Ancylobacter dichloromethanicus]MBS7552587.1 anti-sigma factor [Ancylobacter dichloromethanicus]GLK71948.1 transcriptional regulator, anti-sigma factor [Ancylobacter dichloromethanicus]